ncbi:nucleotide-binding domain-containing protein [Meredithblackwellia eburnea MCA 4105]
MSKRRKRVAVIGAGAAGMSAAYALSLSPDDFDVSLFERSDHTGGMATSTDIDHNKYNASYINDGVQGASPVFSNTFTMFETLGFFSSKVGMQCSFGKGQDQFWSNVFPTQVIDKYQSDIKRFGKVLNIIKAFEPIFALISVQDMLSLFRFSPEFGETIVFPLVALFFGTGNQTPFISSAILERVFKDPSMRLFEYSPTSFLATIPTMLAFPRLSLVYSTWATHILSTGNTTIHLSHEVTSIQRSSSSHKSEKPVKVWARKVSKVDLGQMVVDPEEEEVVGEFDELIFATDADAALKILGHGASWFESKVLGNVKYLWDVTVTHSDEAYMRKYYETSYSSKLASDKRDSDEEAQRQFEFAQDNFNPLYYIRSYPDDKKKVEMSFDLTHYQPQFDGESEFGPGGTGRPSTSSSSSTLASPPPRRSKEKDSTTSTDGSSHPHKHVYQTIFLDRDGSSEKWSKEEIDPHEVVLTKWWKQQSHRWQHYGGTVPWMWLLNGSNHTRFAGAWTVLNMHEIGIVSGFAAAYKLGAKYPFADNADCKRMFALYLGLGHLSRLRKEDREGFFM